jgi:hypothetical protein
LLNLNLNIAISAATDDNPAEALATKILSSTGSANWGTASGSPQIFGLASDTKSQSSNYYLELSKLARLNKELNFLSVSSLYSYLDPNTLSTDLTNGANNLEFRIYTKPLIKVISTSSVSADISTISISVSTWGNRSLSNINIEVYHVSMSDGSTLPSIQTTTDINGEAVINTNLAPTENYVAVVYAYSGIMWGLSWEAINNNPGTTIFPTGISSFLLNKPDNINNSLLQFSNNTIDNNAISTNTAFFNSNNNNLTISATPSGSGTLINQTLTDIGTNGPIIQVNVVNSDPNYYYRVLTLPLILDYTDYVSPSSSTFETFQYPVYQTDKFSSVNLAEIHFFSTVVQTDRGYLLFTVEVSIN